jgi:hypothetical protein
MHLLDPVAEAVKDHPADDWLVRVQGVTGPRIVGVARAVLLKDVISVVIETAKAEGRTVNPALGGVVENHVEDDLKPGAMQRLDHLAELIDWSKRVFAQAVS